MSQKTCKLLTIFEGPDGSGKSVAAKRFAMDTNAVYVHFGPLNGVSTGLARAYVESMLPALLGYQDVVMDRCWLSESLYGAVYRHGVNRVGVIKLRMLERLALRCATVLVRCQTDWMTVKANFLSRRQSEMLQSTEQLRQIYDKYNLQSSAMPTVWYDYQQQPQLLGLQLEQFRSKPHKLGVRSAGNLEATVLLVGEAFSELGNFDPLYQWPFASFSKSGCSTQLTAWLESQDISEAELLWINADQDLTAFTQDNRLQLQRNLCAVAFGLKAYIAAREVGLVTHQCDLRSIRGVSITL